MSHKRALRPCAARPARPRSGAAWKGLYLALPALLSLGWTGCFRAAGIARTTVVAEAVPEFGGERVSGMKSVAGPGDYYLGNDFVNVAVDGTTWGDTAQTPIAGAAGGGSIVDAGFLALDTSYTRVPMPSDVVERLTPVVNQDPTLEIVADSFTPNTNIVPATLTITGHVLDPQHKIPGATWDDQNRVQGVSVVHVLSLGTLDRFITMSTTVSNDSGSPVGIRSIGDFLSQTSGGFQFIIPAGMDIYGNALAQNWGAEIPGSDFDNPITTAVQAPMVGLLSLEPGSNSVDCHASLGLMSQDTPTCMVTSDPQEVFYRDKPVFPRRIVVGCLPLAPAGLAAGGTLSYNRRLYVNGGTSASAAAPNATNTLFNAMLLAKFNSINGLWVQDYGELVYSLSGSAVKMGPLATEVRLERLVNNGLGGPGSAQVWVPERVEWQEPGENITSRSSFPSSTVTTVLPSGTYRIVVTNQLGTQVKTTSINSLSGLSNLLSGPIIIYPLRLFGIGGQDYLCPEATEVVNDSGAMITSLYSPHLFTTRPSGYPLGAFMPERIVIKGTGGTPDPWMRRARTMGSFFDPITKVVQDAPGGSPGQEQYRAANEMFGTGFFGTIQNSYFWLPNGQVTNQVDPSGVPVINGGSYTAYAVRGPLSDLNSLDIVAYNGQSFSSHPFVITPRPIPAGWTSFDLPGPSQATGGGYLPGEKLASGMAEGVQVIGHTEQDQGTDGNQLYNDFTWAFNASGFLATHIAVVGNDPFVVGARTSTLPATPQGSPGFGTASALFTPPANRYRYDGAIQPNAWQLSDFITQAQGLYTIVHQPRGPQGLFTLQNFTASQVADPSSWWNQTGPYANGVTNGAFDALELLRGEGFDRTNPDPWFQQFLQVRSDWFSLLNIQSPSHFTKALGLSCALFSLDTPVGLARTYLKAAPVVTVPPSPGISPPVPLVQDLTSVLTALQTGAAVASTGPLLDVSVNGVGPGGLVAGSGPNPTVSLNLTLWMSGWMPVDEIRIIVNGQKVATVDPATLLVQPSDPRWFVAPAPITVTMPTTGTGAWIVVEAGVRLTQTGPYVPGTPWDFIMRGIYPIAVTNPIFVDVTGNGYTPPQN